MPRICMVCDFFLPNNGGVENHIHELSNRLRARGHEVLVVTHAYEGFEGEVTLRSGLRVVYLPLIAFYNQCTFPTVFFSLPQLRKIFLQNSIDVVHCHSAFSSLCHEALLAGKVLGLKTVFTDHSLFGFSDVSSILTNKLLQFSLCDVDQAICVSRVGRDNTLLRSNIASSRLHVIGNAVDTTLFTPSPAARPTASGGEVVIVVVSRLVMRKGADLLASVIPAVCSRWPHVRFVVAGDGPKRALLERMREINHLQKRVSMLGAVPHDHVSDVLRQGHIFLNCSLTEAFCMAIVEAASCGLLVVSTNVGGIPEVLPTSLAVLSPASIDGMVAAVGEALSRLSTFDPAQAHAMVRAMYDWKRVAQATEAVYDTALEIPTLSVSERLALVSTCGPVAGKVFSLIVLVAYAIMWLLHALLPRTKTHGGVNKSIDVEKTARR